LWFLLMFTSRMKWHSVPFATGNVPLDNQPLSWLFPSLRATSRQLFLSADVSTSHNF
jgi:hypothetical protein